MMCRLATIVLWATISTGGAAYAGSQRPPAESPRLVVLARLIDVDILPQPRTVRIYRAQEEWSLNVSVGNSSTRALSIGRADLDGEFDVTVSRGRELIPVVLHVDSALRLGGNQLTVSRGDTIRLKPDDGFEAIVRVRRWDGRAFGAGHYELTLSLRTRFQTAVTDTGEKWSGVVPNMMTFAITVSPPMTATERAAAHRLSGYAALAREDTSEALRFFESAVREDPADPQSLIPLGTLYLRMRRYREAVRPLEAALASTREPRAIAERLAHAYVGIGDEKKAAHVLKLVTSESRIPEAIRELRALVQRH